MFLLSDRERPTNFNGLVNSISTGFTRDSDVNPGVTVRNMETKWKQHARCFPMNQNLEPVGFDQAGNVQVPFNHAFGRRP